MKNYYKRLIQMIRYERTRLSWDKIKTDIKLKTKRLRRENKGDQADIDYSIAKELAFSNDVSLLVFFLPLVLLIKIMIHHRHCLILFHRSVHYRT